MIPEQLALLLIKQKNHNKRFGEFEFEYFGDSDVVNKLQINLVQKLEEWQTVNLGGQRHCKDFLPFFFVWRLFYKDWSDQINTFFEYFFPNTLHNRTKKITQVSQIFLQSFHQSNLLEYFIKHPNICQV